MRGSSIAVEGGTDRDMSAAPRKKEGGFSIYDSHLFWDQCPREPDGIVSASFGNQPAGPSLLATAFAFSSAGMGFPVDSAGEEATCSAGGLGSIPGLGRSPTPVFWPGEFHGILSMGSQRVRHD